MSTTKKKNPTPAPVRSRRTPAAPKAVAQGPVQPHQLAIGLEDLKALIGLVAKEAIDDFEFQSGDVRFHIRKGSLVQAPAAPAIAASYLPPMPPLPAHTLVASAQPAPEKAEDPGIHHITSPIVGTFYRAPTASGAPYVQPGDFVKPGQTLCIVEAMKLMNEIECDVAGEVVAVMVENGQPVEYGERLFAVRIR
jgi:acetyl-CoA carboxylase biotin carboxyl carrier protein